MGLAFFYTLFPYTEGCILNTTDHYQLNQWEGTDRILRTDFNADNAKVDAAIAAVRDACPMVKLLDTSLQTAASQMTVSLPTAILDQYRELWAYMTLSSDTTATYIYLRLNNLTEYWDSTRDPYSYLATAEVDRLAAENTFIRFSIFLGQQIAGGCLNVYRTSSQHWVRELDPLMAELSTAALTKLTLVSDSGQIGAGSRVTILGIRA